MSVLDLSTRGSLADGMADTKAIVTGFWNHRSISAAILREFGRQRIFSSVVCENAEVVETAKAFCNQHDCRAIGFYPCNVSNDSQLVSLAEAIESHKTMNKFDVLVHSIGFAPPETLRGNFSEVTTREAFHTALDVSAYSLIALVRTLRPFLNPGASIITLTYDAVRFAVPNYNLMGVAKAALEASARYLAAELGPEGIRVNAISAGPIRTLSSRGIEGSDRLLKATPKLTPLGRATSQESVAKAVLYLASDLSEDVTGEVHHVDCGQHIVSSIGLGREEVII